MGHQKIRSLRVLALGLSLALAMIGLFTWAPLGHAAPSTDTVVNPNTKGSITVHVLEGGTINDKPTGEVDGKTSSATQVNGASFKLTKQSGIDVTTIEGMQNAAKVTVDSFNPDSSFGTSGAMTGTTVNGEYKFSDLKPGVYLLEQTSAPKGYQKAIKSVIVLPLTNTAGNGFIYDIHVYPKNAKAGKITKENTTPEGTFLKEGSEMTFKITVPIPAKDDKNPYTEFSVTDTPVSGLELTTNSITKIQLGTEDLTSSTHFNVTKDNNNIKVSFTTDGLSKLNGISSETNLLVYVKGTVKGVADAGAVKNKASYTYKRKDGSTGGGETGDDDSNPDSTLKFGFIKITNVEAGTSTNLTGAKFKIGKCSDGEKSVSKKTDEVLSSDVAAGETVLGPVGMLETGKLCVEQTQAPTGGYALNPEATAKSFDSAALTSVSKSAPMEFKIENTKASDFLSKLPLTGGPGVIAFLVGGALLLIAAVATMVRKRRQDQE
ncbi:SpaH/EbpB family LPXTG-anchored major pilin [Mobiluncus mulieris]|uniref:SpaH/EbpB family LPXTG-anchored major pilin n=1 Tax=Mobiluncus mulieris TaxID=2052 RepID=UPI00146FD54F|nr:SpaH/EbpB family LPXTG-anchored major pilin [Mobiluncus mulieris]MCU9970193.1 isopeptide-forming domain-containing fimbrial protein [Mobiluncus mulieris]MCU9995290.1 isopeptide-forming domain-containing fimbrial protein [Mobiluncus mulieris]MCV0012992.1 isopeptide-forming domain-containing fimbrial protein [Mobiluncus mulieris]NMW60290.1 SpaH/EbpB family LPXTG-anchored major pilin [Mobiluncus mulieris]NMW89946.1 SpaH/EbpB family LPXTG-anchored major pilin [Mobiluncus mulieris]